MSKEIDVDLKESDSGVVTKNHLAKVVSEQIGLNKRESKDMIDTFFDLITDALKNSENVKLAGFGNFELRDKAARPGRNPKTGEVVQIEARRVVVFHSSQKLKDQLVKIQSHKAD